MTTNRKNELIAQLVNILSELIEANDSEQVTEVSTGAVEMLTVRECTSARIKTKHPKVFKKEKIWYNVKVREHIRRKKHGNTETVHTGI